MAATILQRALLLRWTAGVAFNDAPVRVYRRDHEPLYEPDLTTPISTLRDAIEAQSARALALQARVMQAREPVPCETEAA